jgi:hypothetical protein
MDWKKLEQVVDFIVNSLFTAQGLSNDLRHVRFVSQKCVQICKRHIEFNVTEFGKSTEEEKEAEMTEENESLRTSMLLKKQIKKIDNSLKKYDEELESLEDRFRFIKIERLPPSLIEKLVRMLEDMKDYEPSFFLNIRDISLDSWKESLNFEKILKDERKKFEEAFLKLEGKFRNRFEFVKQKSAEKIIRLEKNLKDLNEENEKVRERLGARVEDLASWIKRKSENDAEMIAVIKQAGFKGFRDVIRALKNMEKLKVKMNTQLEGLGKEIKGLKGKLNDSNVKLEAFKRRSEGSEENIKDLENSFIALADLFLNPGEKKSLEGHINEKNYFKLKDSLKVIENNEKKRKEDLKKKEEKKEPREEPKEEKKMTKNIKRNETESKNISQKNEQISLNKTSKNNIKKDPSSLQETKSKEAENSSIKPKNPEEKPSKPEFSTQDPKKSQKSEPVQEVKKPPIDLSSRPSKKQENFSKSPEKTQKIQELKKLIEKPEIFSKNSESKIPTPESNREGSNQVPSQVLSSKGSKVLSRHRRSLDSQPLNSKGSSEAVRQGNPVKTLKNSLRKIFSTEVLKSAGLNAFEENGNILNSIQKMNLEELLSFKLQVNGETKSLQELALENIQNAFKKSENLSILQDFPSKLQESRKTEEKPFHIWRNSALKFFVLLENYLEAVESRPGLKIEEVLLEALEKDVKDDIINYLKSSENPKSSVFELAAFFRRECKYELLNKVLGIPIDLASDWKSDKIHIFNKIRWKNLIMGLRLRDHQFLSDLAFRIEVEVRDRRKKTKHSESNSSIAHKDLHNYSNENIALNEVKSLHKRGISMNRKGLNYFLPHIKTPRADKSFGSIPNSFITGELWVKNK